MLEDQTCPADRRQVLNMTGVHRRRCQGKVRAVTDCANFMSNCMDYIGIYLTAKNSGFPVLKTIPKKRRGIFNEVLAPLVLQVSLDYNDQYVASL
jgi:hypothetical protein